MWLRGQHTAALNLVRWENELIEMFLLIEFVLSDAG